MGENSRTVISPCANASITMSNAFCASSVQVTRGSSRASARLFPPGFAHSAHIRIAAA